MTIKLDDTIVCEVVTQAVEAGVTYALIRPDGRTEIYARRSYLTDGIASLLRKAVYKRLARGDKSKAAGSWPQRIVAEGIRSPVNFVPLDLQIWRESYPRGRGIHRRGSTR